MLAVATPALVAARVAAFHSAAFRPTFHSAAFRPAARSATRASARAAAEGATLGSSQAGSHDDPAQPSPAPALRRRR